MDDSNIMGDINWSFAFIYSGGGWGDGSFEFHVGDILGRKVFLNHDVWNYNKTYNSFMNILYRHITIELKIKDAHI